MKEYLSPYFEASEFESEDIMTSSGGTGDEGGNWDVDGEWRPLGEEIDVIG